MIPILGQMAVLVAIGLVWQWWRPGGLDATHTRKVISGVVYYLLLPALVMVVLTSAPLGLDSLRISLSAAVGEDEKGDDHQTVDTLANGQVQIPADDQAEGAHDGASPR